MRFINMKQTPKKPGPEPEILKIEGMNWKDAMKKALQKRRPAEGWPKAEPKRKRKLSPSVQSDEAADA
jgi:hypothetical protein